MYKARTFHEFELKSITAEDRRCAQCRGHKYIIVTMLEGNNFYIHSDFTFPDAGHYFHHWDTYFTPEPECMKQYKLIKRETIKN